MGDNTKDAKAKTATTELSNPALGYLQLPPDIDLKWPKQESFQEKFTRKIKENPFVPVGLGVTCFALIYGIRNMMKGDTAMSQKMMRLRVGAQGFTVVALLGGIVYSAQKKERLAKESIRE